MLSLYHCRAKRHALAEFSMNKPKNKGVCSVLIAAEQKARTTYDNILRLVDDPDVKNVIRFLRERELVHYQRFGDPKRTYGNDDFLADRL